MKPIMEDPAAEPRRQPAINADLATNFEADMVDLGCCSFSGEVY